VSTSSSSSRRAYLTRYVTLTTVVYLMAIAAGLVYAAATPDRPNRGPLLLVGAVALVSAAAFVPARDRVARSPRMFVILLARSSMSFVFVGAVAHLDGGVKSPFMALVFVSVLFAAMTYPPRIVAVTATLATLVVTVVAMSTTTGPNAGTAAEEAMFAAMVATAGVMSVLASRTLERHHAAQQTLTQQLDELAGTDPLTGCTNRRRFEAVVEAALTDVDTHDRCVAFLLFDVDDFKGVNDEHGHLVGDVALQQVAGVLHRGVRGDDTVARLGGDEFAVFLPGTTFPEANALALRLQASLGEVTMPVPLSACVGVAAGVAGETDLDALLAEADTGLYRQKRRRTSASSGSDARRAQAEASSS
jgi:diguanylate cyclase (GGDEF)-like protein